MSKHKSNKIKENSNTVRHLIMGQITTTQNLVAIKEVRHAGQQGHPGLLGVVVEVFIYFLAGLIAIRWLGGNIGVHQVNKWIIAHWI